MNKAWQEILTEAKGRGDLLIALKKAQDKYGYLPGELIAELAKRFDLSIGDVYGVGTFYSFLSTKPQGRNEIRICKSVPCFLKNCETIIDWVEKELGIKPGESTADSKFSLQLTNCIGHCDEAPAMMVNDEIHVNLTPRKISKILQSYK